MGNAVEEKQIMEEYKIWKNNKHLLYEYSICALISKI